MNILYLISYFCNKINDNLSDTKLAYYKTTNISDINIIKRNTSYNNLMKNFIYALDHYFGTIMLPSRVLLKEIQQLSQKPIEYQTKFIVYLTTHTEQFNFSQLAHKLSEYYSDHPQIIDLIIYLSNIVETVDSQSIVSFLNALYYCIELYFNELNRNLQNTHQ